MIRTIADLTGRQIELIKAHKATIVYAIPNCDFCTQAGQTRKAEIDGRTSYGPWANMCAIHRANNAVAKTQAQLGTGFGQILIESQHLTSEEVRRS